MGGQNPYRLYFTYLFWGGPVRSYDVSVQIRGLTKTMYIDEGSLGHTFLPHGLATETLGVLTLQWLYTN